jgi:hypothetical protein
METKTGERFYQPFSSLAPSLVALLIPTSDAHTWLRDPYIRRTYPPTCTGHKGAVAVDLGRRGAPCPQTLLSLSHDLIGSDKREPREAAKPRLPLDLPASSDA